MTCLRKGCDKPIRTRGYCERHYRYLLHTGRITDGKRVDATEAREHLHKLRELHWTIAAIGEASGVSPRQVSSLLRGEYVLARLSTTQKILSVPLTESSWHHGVDPTGSQRRVQALQWMGWPAKEIAARCGSTPSTIWAVSHRGGGANGRVSSRLAKRIAALFDELGHIPGPSKQTATKARNRGYAPALAWDAETIDDPGAEPQLGERKPRSATVVASEARFLARFGTSEEEIAKRLGVTVSTLRGYLGRAA